jgi:hypothetical protein
VQTPPRPFGDSGLQKFEPQHCSVGGGKLMQIEPWGRQASSALPALSPRAGLGASTAAVAMAAAKQIQSFRFMMGVGIRSWRWAGVERDARNVATGVHAMKAACRQEPAGS